MAGKKGEPQIKHTDEEKLKIGLLVCQLYESQGATLESCCEAAGVPVRTFRLWAVQLAELADAYKKVKAVQDQIFWDRLKPIAKSAFERLLTGETKTERKDESGTGANGPFTKESITTSEVLPNPTVTIFAMKGVFPDMFVEKTQAEVNHTGNVGVQFVFETGGAAVFGSEKDVIEDDSATD